MSISSPIIASVILHLLVPSMAQYMPMQAQQMPSMPGYQLPSMQAPMGSSMVMPQAMQSMPGMQAMQRHLPQQRVPVMVMPYHSKAADKKYMKRRRRKPKKYYADSEASNGDSEESCSSSDEYLRVANRRSGHRKKKRQVLTPVISYVTRSGRVVYQKKIRKDNAGDWLELGQKKIPSKLVEEEADERASGDMTVRELKDKYGLKNKNHHHDHNR